MKDKILFYVEPHPIRNWFSEYRTVANVFINIAQMAEIDSDYEWKIFSNSYITKEIEKKFPEFNKSKILSTTEEESEGIDLFLREWNQEEIKKRNEFVNFEGEYFDFYYKLIERIYEEFKFTCVIIWSENGAIKKFSQDKGIKIIHMELGPTRKPFYPTICIDPFGTNAYSSLRRANKINLDSVITNKDFWERMSLFSDDDEKFLSAMECKLRDFSLERMKSDKLTPLGNLIKGDYIIIGLQLTDDLNTQLHSKFESPLDFLREVTPLLIEKGFKVLIKTHPMSHIRPYNLIKEVEAISFIKGNYGEKVIVLESDISQRYFIQLCANAKAVISINSSISFESWLLGTPGLILGEAVYDNNDVLSKKSNDFLISGEISEDLLKSSKIIEYGLEKYFLPFDYSYIAENLCKIIANYELFKTPDLYIKWLEENIENNNFFIRKNIKEIRFFKSLINNSTNYYNVNEKFRYFIDRCDYKENKIILSGWIFNINELNDQLKLYLEIDGFYTELTYIYRETLYKHKPFLKLGLNPEVKYGFHLNKSIDLNENLIVKLLVISKNGNYYIDLTEKLITDKNKKTESLTKEPSNALVERKKHKSPLGNEKIKNLSQNEKLKKFSIYKYIKYKIASKITFGNMRKRYKEKYLEQKRLKYNN